MSAWTWFGTSAERFYAARRERAGRELVSGGELLNAALREHRSELLAFDECLDYRDDLAWHASDIAERNPYVSSFLVRAAAELAKAQVPTDVEVVDDFGGRPHALRLARAAARRARFVRGAAPRTPEPCDALIVTWADGDYFGGLPDRLRGDGLRVAELALLGTKPGAFSLDDVVGTRRRAAAAARTLRTPARVVRPFVVGGVDLTHVLRATLAREAASMRRVWAEQLAEVGPWLARHGVEPRLVVVPFENQSWEKALRLGMRRTLPRTEVVGYQHTPTSFPAWFPCTPSRRDLAEGQLPDRIELLGPRWVDEFAAAGYPRERLRVTHAFRYEHLRATPPRAEGRYCLVACSGNWDEALELAVKSVEHVRDEPLLIKTHPDQHANDDRFRAAVAQATGAISANVSFSTTPVSELLPHATRLLHTFTAVAWEAVAYGVPTEFVRSDFRIDVDPLPGWASVADAFAL